MKIEYLTSNRQKFEEARHILADWELEHVALELMEIQGKSEEIIQAKAREALHLLRRPLIVEDISVSCPAIGGLPGPYVKDFLKALGEVGFYELISKYEDHSVNILCLTAFIKPGSDPVVFSGSISGMIVAPKGVTKHGEYSWNSIIKPNGFDKTFGEMTLQDHSRFSMRYLALTKLKNYLEQQLL